MQHVLADKYALTIDEFNVTDEMLDEKAYGCERIVALKDAEETFSKR